MSYLPRPNTTATLLDWRRQEFSAGKVLSAIEGYVDAVDSIPSSTPRNAADSDGGCRGPGAGIKLDSERVMCPRGRDEAL